MPLDTDFSRTIDELGRVFASRAAKHDETGEFVAENFKALRERRVFSAMIPKDLGGGGVSHREMCRALRGLAQNCGSTALSLSMHQHLIAGQVWNHLHGKPVRKLLERVASEQLVLISTGANDWLTSSGRAEKVEGGYRVTARKAFASGSPMGSLLMTSAPYEDPQEGSVVLHFPVPFSATGVRIEDDWRTLGMRGTGSNTVSLENVFVPDEAVGMKRPRGRFHPFFAVVCGVALPIVMSVYVGVADAAAAIGREHAKTKKGNEPFTPYLLGEMQNALTTAEMGLESMMDICNDLQFEPSAELANQVLIRKTIVARAVIDVAEKALETTGGAGIFRSVGLERLLRDVHAAQFHPLAEKKQQLFTGRLALGLDPVSDAT